MGRSWTQFFSFVHGVCLLERMAGRCLLEKERVETTFLLVPSFTRKQVREIRAFALVCLREGGPP